MSDRLIPFVGAGVSMSVRDRKSGQPLFPSWQRLLLAAAERLESENKIEDAELVRACLNERPPKLMEAAGHAKDKLGAVWFRFLADTFDLPRDRVADDSLLLPRSIWGLGSSLVITTNYDRTLYWACPDLENVKIWDIEATAEIADYLRNGGKRPVIWHLHGHVDNAMGMILSPDGYERLYGGADCKPRYEAALFGLQSILAGYSILFIGFSLDDRLFVRVMSEVADALGQSNGPHYVLVRKSDTEKPKLAELTIEVLEYEDFGQPLIDRLVEIAGVRNVAGPRELRGKNDGDATLVFLVPFAAKGSHVVERENTIQALRNQLVSGRTTAIGHTAALTGIGGLGKTQLAVEYAYEYRDFYPGGVFWITADQQLAPQLISICDKAGWFSPDSDDSYKLIVAQERLRSAKDALIILDNVDDLEPVESLLPLVEPSRHLVLTGRHSFREFVPVDLLPLTPEPSLELLLQVAGHRPNNEQDWDAARRIAKEMDGLPLGLELAGAYLSHRPIGWTQYLELLVQDPRGALAASRFVSSTTGHEADLSKALAISEAVLKDEPLLADVVDVLTWSGPAPMRIELLDHLLGRPALAERSSALGLGVKLRILQPGVDRDSFSIHRLVRAIRRDQSPLEDQMDWVRRIGERLLSWFERIREVFEELPRFEAEVDHLRAWEENFRQCCQDLLPKCLWLQAYPGYHRGNFHEAGNALSAARSVLASIGEADMEFEGKLRTDESLIHQVRGYGLEAVASARKAVTLLQATVGDWHAETAKALNMLGAAQRQIREFEPALRSHACALVIWRRTSGRMHADTANALAGLGNTYFHMREYKKARRCFSRSLRLLRDDLGEKHPDTIKVLTSLGQAHAGLGEFHTALGCFEEALIIRSQLVQQNAPETIKLLQNAGSMYMELREYDRALANYEKVWELSRATYGEASAQALLALIDYAGGLSYAGRSHRAVGLLKGVVVHLSERHPQYGVVLGLLRQLSSPREGGIRRKRGTRF